MQRAMCLLLLHQHHVCTPQGDTAHVRDVYALASHSVCIIFDDVLLFTKCCI